jgi:hypothetical protein
MDPTASIGDKIAAAADITLDVGTGINVKDIKAAAKAVEGAAEKVSALRKGPLKNASGSLDESASKARSLPQGDKFRRDPRNLQDKLTMDEAKAGAGEPVPGMGPLKDPRYKGWQKMQHQHEGPDGTRTNVHYNLNPKTGEKADFKFKDD